MIRVDPALCVACGLCVPVCPDLALELRDHGLFIAPCSECGDCIAICPTEALDG